MLLKKPIILHLHLNIIKKGLKMNKKLLITAIASVTLACSGMALAHHGPDHGHKHMPHHEGPHYFIPVHEVDTDKNHVLNKDELAALIANLTTNNNERSAKLVDFKTADTDKNGFVTLDELTVVVPAFPVHPIGPRHHHKDRGDGPHHKHDQAKNDQARPEHGKHHDGPHHKHLKDGSAAFFILSHFDKDGDYKLNPDEYNNFLDHEKKSVVVDKAVIEALKNADLNKDGVVTVAELDTVSKYVLLQNAPAYKERPHKGEGKPDTKAEKKAEEKK
jgi:Ca2+-binding EF-hand superfamily protein